MNTAMEREQLDECLTLMHKLAPELANAYCENAPADGLHKLANCIAYSPRGTDLPVRDALIADGRWRGPGAAIVFCEQVDRQTALALTVHELAHALSVSVPPVDTEPTPELRMLQRLSVEEHIAADKKRPPWEGSHSLPWIRRVLHCHWRSWQVGHEIGLGDCCVAGSRYGLSPHWMYLDAIGGEPSRMKDKTFTEIVTAPYPTEFIELWREDITRWFRTNPDFVKEKL